MTATLEERLEQLLVWARAGGIRSMTFTILAPDGSVWTGSASKHGSQMQRDTFASDEPNEDWIEGFE